jgi:Methyltransferase domain
MSSKPPAPRRTGLAALRGWFGLVVIVAVLVVLRLLLSLFTQFGDTLYVSDAAAIAELQAVGRRARALHGAHRRGEPLHVDPPCSLVPYGTGYGRHDLCNLSAISALSDSRLSPADAEPPCLVVSVGINKDFSFDQDIHRMHGCEGVAFDPSITHPSILNGTKLRFLQLGLRAPSHLEYGSTWDSINFATFRAALGHRHLAVLKVDCEGCEYQMYRDIVAAQYPDFFRTIDQVAFEVHAYSKFAATDALALDLGRMYVLMRRSGLTLVSAVLTACGDSSGYLCDNAVFKEAGYPCTRVGCQDLGFARLPQTNSKTRD